MERDKGPVWPLILAIVLIYLLAAIIDPCDSGCVQEVVR